MNVMAEGRRGLGRGLSALLGDADEGDAAEAGAIDSLSVREMPIELLHRNPDQPRWVFGDEELEELAGSIRDKGVLQPILVRPKAGLAGEYEIVAGERRWRAAQKAGLKTVPIITRELDDLQVLEIAVIENVQRADLSAIEEANAYRQLMDRFGRSQETVAEAVGKSRSHVANTLRLLALPQGVQDHLIARRLTAGHARAIATATNPDALADIIVAKNLSVREAESLARKADAPKKASGPRKVAPRKDADTLALENDLADVLGLAVEVVDRGGAGEIRIQYESLEQLDDVCRRLTRT